jgi:hypothetical protein
MANLTIPNFAAPHQFNWDGKAKGASFVGVVGAT